MSKNVRRGRSGIGSVCVLGIVCVIATTAPIIPADAASQVEVSASTNFEVESVVAGSNPTIVLNGSGLPEVPAGDIGQATDTPYLLVTDSTGFLGSWNAGYTGDGCTVTIGESTATTMVFRVNAPSVSCPDYSVSAGDSVSVTLFDGSGNQLSSVGTTAVAPSGQQPTISSVNPPDGPQGGGTSFADPSSGAVTLAGSFNSTEAVWFGSLATTAMTAEGSGDLSVTPPSSSEAQGVSVQVVGAGGTSSTGLGCAVIQSGACPQGYFYMAQTSLDATVPALNITSGLQWNDTLAQTEDNACSPNGNNSASGTFSISLSGSIQGGPVTVSGNLDSSSNDGIPSAFTGNATIDIQNAITATLNITGTIGDCASIPIPGLSLPDGVGFYLVLGGSVSGSFTETVTVDAGTYSIAGGWIPGDELGLSSSGVSVSCTGGSSLDQCVQSSSSLNLSGTLSANPIWFQIGPPNAFIGVGASAQWFTQLSTSGQNTGSDVCWGVIWAYQITLPDPLSAYSLNGGGTLLGPWNVAGNGSLCPLGTASTPTSAPPISLANATPPEGTVGDSYDDQLVATGGAGAPYSFSDPGGGFPNGLTLSSSGVIGGTPTQSGQFDPTVVVTDSAGNNASVTISLTVAAQVTSPPAPLSITTTSLPPGEQTVSYKAAIGTSGGAGQISFNLVSGTLPSGLSLNGTTGVISGTIGSSASSETFTIEASDPYSQQAEQSLTITVTAGPGSGYPVVTSFAPTRSYYLLNGGQFTVHWTSSGPSTDCVLEEPPIGGNPEQYLYFPPTGPASSCQSGSFTVTNVPAQQATYNFTFCLNEPTPSPDCENTNVVVSSISVLNITNSGEEPPATVGQSYCYQLDVSGGQAPYTWSGSGQDGFSVSSTGAICGTPTTAGFPNVSVSVSDTEPIVQTTGTTDQIKVYQTPLTFTSDTLQIAQLGQSFSATIGATGGGCSVPNISVSGLPPGLTSDGEGDITGTPTQGGTFAVTATASACSGPIAQSSISETLTLVVSTPPLIVNGPLSAVCTIDTNCSLVPTASGGTSPYAWSITSGTLPEGLQLGVGNGAISGTPTSSGTKLVTIEATDSSSPTFTASFTMQIDVESTPSELVFTTEPPSSSSSGSTFNLAVSVEDPNGNVVGFSSAPVTLTLSGGASGAALNCGSNPINAVDGVASFGCSVNEPDTGYTLEATSGTLTPATSSAFGITADTASKLVFTTEPPSSSSPGATFKLAVSVENAKGNVVSSSSAPVTLAMSGGASGAALGCASNPITAADGVASFSCSVNKPGTGYKLEATSGSLTKAKSSAFAITAGPIAITQNETLTSDIYCTNLTIEAGVTVTTAGFNIYCTGTVDNAGTIVTGSTPAESFPESYGGSGGGATNLNASGGAPTAGFSTLAPGGSPCTASGCAAGNGSTPSLPRLTRSLLSSWQSEGMSQFLAGASGGSSPSVTGGAGAYGLYVAGSDVIAGTIDAAGSNGTNNPGQSSAGGGGGGTVVIAYGAGGYTPGTVNVSGGWTVEASGNHVDLGGNGSIVPIHLT